LFLQLAFNLQALKTHLVLDLRPEGHQLVKLREFVLADFLPDISSTF